MKHYYKTTSGAPSLILLTSSNTHSGHFSSTKPDGSTFLFTIFTQPIILLAFFSQIGQTALNKFCFNLFLLSLRFIYKVQIEISAVFIHEKRLPVKWAVCPNLHPVPNRLPALFRTKALHLPPKLRLGFQIS